MFNLFWWHIPAFDNDETRNETTFQATSNDIPASRHIELENTDEHKFSIYKSRSSHVCFLTSSFCAWLDFMYQYTPLVRRILSFMWHLCMRLFMIYFLVHVVIFAVIKYYNFTNMSIYPFHFSRRHSNKLTTPGNLKNYKFPFAIKVIINNKNEIKPWVETFIYAFTSSNVTKCLRKNVFLCR